VRASFESITTQGTQPRCARRPDLVKPMENKFGMLELSSLRVLQGFALLVRSKTNEYSRPFGEIEKIR
jgi:hypothetical protein